VNLETYGMRFYNESNPNSDTVDLGKDDVKILIGAWNPLKDWNHWRQVEEKIMEDGDLFGKLVMSFGKDLFGQNIIKYLQADLPTRCKALCSVLPKKDE